MKKIFFISLSLSIGVLLACMIAELGIRFYLFGPRLHYEDNRVIDRRIFSKDKKHVFFVGDSFTQGYPYPVDKSYPVILEKLLRNKDIKITNFALSGTTFYEQEKIIQDISELKPSLIVWGLSSNDVYLQDDKNRLNGNENSFKERLKINYFKHAFFDLPYDCLVNAKMGVFSTIKEVLGTYSYLYIFLRLNFQDSKMFKFLRERFNPFLEHREVTKGFVFEYARKDGPLQTRLLEEVLYVKQFLKERNINFILLYVPHDYDVNEKIYQNNIKRYGLVSADYDRFRIRKSIKEFCLENGIPFIDFSFILEQEVKEGKALFIKPDRHYNYYGNTLMARLLSENKDFLSLFK